MALLVALDRKHPLVATVVVVERDGSVKGGMQSLETVFENVVEADQQRWVQVPGSQAFHQLHEIERSTPIATGLHHHMAP